MGEVNPDRPALLVVALAPHGDKKDGPLNPFDLRTRWLESRAAWMIGASLFEGESWMLSSHGAARGKRAAKAGATRPAALTANACFSVSAIALAVALLTASPQVARAADECGATVAGADTITCSGASYPTGITYAPVDAMTLNLNNPGMGISGTGLSVIQGVAGGPSVDVVLNATRFGTITTTGTAITVRNNRNIGLAAITMAGGSITSASISTSVLVEGLVATHLQMTMNGGRIANTDSGAGILVRNPSFASTGNASVTINGGIVESAGSGVRSLLNGLNSTGVASIFVSAGSVLATGSNGLWAETRGSGLARVEMTGGTVVASGSNGDGVFAQSRLGSYAVDVTGGTVTGGSGSGAAIHTSAAAGGIVNIGAGATLNAGASGVALRDGDLDRDGVDEIGGNSVITTAGTLNGAIVLGGGTDTLTVTGGAINGNITGDGADALNFNLGANSFTHGAAYAISGMNGVVMNSGTARLDGSVSGNTLAVNGGTLVLGSAGNFAGGTVVNGGTLTVNGTLNSTVNVGAQGRLQGTGSVGTTTVAGTVAPGNSIGTLLVAGDYAGSGGTLEIEGVFNGTGSPADRLVITGNATGTTTVQTINLGGAGAATGVGNTDGISIVQVGGASTADAFSLAGGYAAAGPYQYELAVFDAATSAPGEADPLLGGGPFTDFRLQSRRDASGNPVAVPQIAGYQALPTGAVRYGASLLESLHKRQGELRDGAAARGKSAEPGLEDFYVRAQGSGNEVDGHRASGYDQDIWYLQAGGNVFRRDMDDGGTWRVGGAFSHGRSRLKAEASSAKVDLEGTTLAVTSTYRAASNWYLDGVAQLTDYEVGIQTSERGATGSPEGWGLGLSVEAGYPVALGNGVVLEPQAQLAYQKIKFDTFVDVDRVLVDLQGGESLRGRVGGRLKKGFNTGTARAWSVYVEGHLVHEFLKAGRITAGGVGFASDSLGTSAQVGGGVNAQIGANKTFFASLNYAKGLSSAAADTWSGNLGLRIDF